MLFSCWFAAWSLLQLVNQHFTNIVLIFRLSTVTPPPPQSAHISLSSFFLQPPKLWEIFSKTSWECKKPAWCSACQGAHWLIFSPVISRPHQDSGQCVMGQFCDIKYINRIQHTCKQHTSNVKMMSSPGHAGIL